MSNFKKECDELAQDIFAKREIDKLVCANDLVESMLRHNSEYPHSANEFTFDNIVNIVDSETEECKEVMQWFICDEWIAEKLESIGEVILRANSLNFWGRTCCGQAIEQDGTFQKIHSLLNK